MLQSFYGKFEQESLVGCLDSNESVVRHGSSCKGSPFGSITAGHTGSNRIQFDCETRLYEQTKIDSSFSGCAHALLPAE